ncbi:acyl transferase domain-containing protein [Kibdelosporangium phytohabitans]|uniref:Carrier domain-containing protein n=1 Tax=Kibdelosporangium phytohabitans TaxID=860235 RepID=A0A0N9HJI3_9PSEU|nr:hypothetical protein AOZ06_04060 [Kibdelosporangium phytohabitans]MBE1465691.1 acyl transferase domain-containing protein [Kibdelosporangium phytohabitans]
MTAALAPVDQAAMEYGHPSVTALLTDRNAPELEELARTPIRLHLATFGIGVSMHAVFATEKICPDVVLGHSTGELVALVAAGCLSAYDAARVLCEREAALDELDPGGGLVAVHAPAERVVHLCGAADDWTLSPTLYNSPRQNVVAGRVPGLTILEDIARVAGVSVSRLALSYPHHSPLLTGPATRLAEVTSDYRTSTPQCRVYSPVLRGYVTGGADVRSIINVHLISPVHFSEALQHLYGAGEVEWFVEAGARSILTDLASDTLPATIKTSAPLRTPVGVDEVLLTLGRPRAATATRTTLPATSGSAGASQGRTTAVVRPDEPDRQAVTVESPGSVTRPTSSASDALPSRPELHAELRHLFAEALGYPEDVFEDDAHLEADLGIASVRKTELLVKILDRYGLPTPTSEMRVRDFNTIPKLADLIFRLAERSKAVLT